MPIDPSIPLQAGNNLVKPVNPMDALGQMAQTGNALMGLQNLQMQVRGRNALMGAYQHTPIDPKTGLPDTNILLSNLAADPAGALVMPQVIQGVQEQQKRAYELNALGLTQTTNRSAALNNALGPLLRMGNNVTPGDVYGAVQQLHAAGFPTDEMVHQLSAGMPTLSPSNANNPAAQAQYGSQLHSWLVNSWARSLPPDAQSKIFTPSVGTVSNGAATLTYDQNPQTNPGVTNMVVPQKLTPEQQLQQVSGPVGPGGAKTVMPQGAYASQSGLGNLIMPGTGPAQPSVFGNGRFPGSPQAPAGSAPPFTASGVSATANPFGTAGAAPGMGPGTGPGMAPGMAGAPAPMPGAPMVTALGPGQQAAITSAGTEGQNQANTLTSSAADSPARQSQISAMLGDLTKFGSGPTSPFWGNVRGRMVQAGVAPETWVEGQSAQENFTKMANQYLARQASALGPVTNDKLALAGESGPNPLFTTLGNQGVLHIAQGNEDALNTRNQAWLQAQQTQGLTGADFPTWSTQFNQSFTPSAFWYARMAPQERQTLISGMSPQDQAQLHGNIVSAVNQGWIDPSKLIPQGANGAASGAASGTGASSGSDGPMPQPAGVGPRPNGLPAGPSGGGMSAISQPTGHAQNSGSSQAFPPPPMPMP